MSLMLKSILVVASILLAAQANAASITLAWNANQEPVVTGYVVLVGTASGRTDQEFNVGLQTSWTFGSATPGTTYFFRVQAYTAAGVRSVPSNEVSGSAGTTATAVPPFGSFDTPANNVQGVTASVAVTGWALDDRGVTRVRILRAPVAGEQPGLVYIGDASLVPGARPDIAAKYPTFVQNDRAGWGYLLLTNFLPNLGNSTVTLYAYAEDADGHSSLLGTRTMTCTNASAVLPFGAIDTPGQGATVSGVVNNFGWVLSPGGRRADPPGGGTVTVVIDGVPVGSPAGWTSRGDLTTLFQGGGYAGLNLALGVFTFDTRNLTNGVHTIAWGVTDNANRASGVGSRYFTVANGSAVTAALGVSTGQAWSTEAPTLLGRRGFDLNAPFHSYTPNANGFVTVQSEELDRIELQTGATTAALLTAEGRRPLPIGAGIDADGIFTWQPVAGFVGAYDFIFSGAGAERYVQIVLNAKGSGRVGPQIVIDTPSGASRMLAANQPFTVAGWAADLDDDLGTGVDAIHVWAYPVGGADPVFVGLAALGGTRPDVAAVYGRRFTKSGYGVTGTGLPAGDYDLAVFAWSTVRQGFVPAKTVRVTVR
jgi:hypothetical protein